jgi:hypothetical protein
VDPRAVLHSNLGWNHLGISDIAFHASAGFFLSPSVGANGQVAKEMEFGDENAKIRLDGENEEQKFLDRKR